MLEELAKDLRERFEREKRVLSFGEYLSLVEEHPRRHTRDAVRFVRDMFDHYGSYELAEAWGPARRFRLFDQPFGEDAERERLIGHEGLQEEFYRILGNFVREGRANRLTLIHGPNGSAKSTFATCMMRALEHYSGEEDGALYSFAWIFPRGRDGNAIGFGSRGDSNRPPSGDDSFAHLPEDAIEVRLASELREHPLLLLPLEARREFVRKLFAKSNGSPTRDMLPSDMILHGQLGRKNQMVFDALMTAYRGDLKQVLGHVRVERYAISRAYRTGAVTIGPQMAVDAQERQITANRALGSLPASLATVSLFEASGELVDAAGGILEFSDLLKRPVESWKYLLLAIETGEVSLSFSNLALNCVMIASANEQYLSAFKEHPEYRSFRGRLELVRAPYLLDYRKEQAIYDAQIVPHLSRPVAPHTTYVAALWAVLTRLRRPQGDRYRNRKLGRIVNDLSPLEKAELYAGGQISSRLSGDDAVELAAGVIEVVTESVGVAVYEGLTGASPREIRTLILDAAQHPEYECVSPLPVLELIEQLCEQNDYEFLKETPERGYQDHRAFIGQVRQRWLDRLDDEVRSASGLVDETRYMELFERYVTHVSYWVKGERAYNRITGKYEDPDQELMSRIEKVLDAGSDATSFRKDLISTVAAHAIDNPGQKVEYAKAFPRYLQRVKEAYFNEHKKRVAEIAIDMVDLLREELGSHSGSPARAGDPTSAPKAVGLDEERRNAARKMMDAMEKRFAYPRRALFDVVNELIRIRYA